MHEMEHSIDRTPQQVRGSLAIYIHWPFCKSKCPYCDFNSHVREGVDQRRWQQALLRELEHMAKFAPAKAEVSSIFFGGGTPSLMPPDTVAALITRVHALWAVSKDIEITLEANPTSVEAVSFKDFRAAGVNRLSLGVQSLRDEELRFLGRGHNAKEALKAIDLARQTFDRYSFDLIYARPQQTAPVWKQELTEALSYADGHLSLYQLTIEENTAFHHTYAKGGFTLPDEAGSEALYRITEEIMAAHGLPPYEVSNYARPGQESRHNLAYWQGMDYIGVGPGAHGRLTLQRNVSRMPDVREQMSKEFLISDIRHLTSRFASQTLKSPERWLEAVERNGHGIEVWQPLDRRTDAEERLMMGLRLAEGINYATFEKQAGYDLHPHIDQKKLRLFTDEGLLKNHNERLQTTLKGRLVLNRLTAELLI